MIKEEIKKLIENNMNEAFKEYDEEIKQNLIKVSLKSLNENLQKLQTAIKEKNKEDIIFHAHSIKGIFLNTRCPDLAEDFNDVKLKNLSLTEIIEQLTNSLKKVV